MRDADAAVCQQCKHEQKPGCVEPCLSCALTNWEPKGPPTELDKLDANSDAIDTIHDFLTWLAEQSVMLCTLQEVEAGVKRLEARWMPQAERTDKLVYRYLDIDWVKLEQERREVLRQAQQATLDYAAKRAAEDPKE